MVQTIYVNAPLTLRTLAPNKTGVKMAATKGAWRDGRDDQFYCVGHWDMGDALSIKDKKALT